MRHVCLQPLPNYQGASVTYYRRFYWPSLSGISQRSCISWGSLKNLIKTVQATACAVQPQLSHTGEGWESSSCSVYRTGCLSKPDLTLEAWKIPGEIMIFSLHWELEEVSSNTKKYNGSSRTGGLASKSAGKQAKCNISFFHVLLFRVDLDSHQKMWLRYSMGLPASNNLIKKISHRHLGTLSSERVHSVPPLRAQRTLRKKKQKEFKSQWGGRTPRI